MFWQVKESGRSGILILICSLSVNRYVANIFVFVVYHYNIIVCTCRYFVSNMDTFSRLSGPGVFVVFRSIDPVTPSVIDLQKYLSAIGILNHEGIIGSIVIW